MSGPVKLLPEMPPSWMRCVVAFASLREMQCLPWARGGTVALRVRPTRKALHKMSPSEEQTATERTTEVKREEETGDKGSKEGVQASRKGEIKRQTNAYEQGRGREGPREQRNSKLLLLPCL